MKMSRRRGFTLIELLVVIAIIAILAAMLFPVFARARESARKIQCLSNFKNLALAFNMYLTDYDKFPPDAADRATLDYFDASSGSGPGGCGGPCNNHQTCAQVGWPYYANPYLRLPVILDTYVKNRDIWKCPSAKFDTAASTIVPDYYPGGWLQYMKNTAQTKWGQSASWPYHNFGPCRQSGDFPPGWGGTVTDSFVQGQMGDEGGPNAFVQSIDINVGPCMPDNGYGNAGLNTSRVEDPAKYVVVVEKGVYAKAVFTVLQVAFPQGGRLDAYICGGGGDWANCSWSQNCSVGTGDDAKGFATSATYRKQYTRHLGGSNLGFADGHAKWYPAESILAEGPKNTYGGCCGPIASKDLQGLAIDGPPTWPLNGGPMPADFAGCGFTYPPIY